MKISIAMATYNGAMYLEKQLESISKQLLLPDELVVCDDGSGDKTLEILESFARTASFNVRIFQNEKNLGYVKNFEKALALCSGDLVFISDQDDYWFPEKLERMNDHFMKHQKDFLLQVDMVITDNDLNPSTCTLLGNTRTMGFPDQTLACGCGMALRREWLELILPFPDFQTYAVGHDEWIHKLSCALNARALIDSPLQYYRRHENAASKWHTSKLGKIGLRSAIGRRLNLGGAVEDWTRELVIIKAILDQINAKAELIDSMRFNVDRKWEVKKLEDKIISYGNRINLCLKSRPRRVLMIFDMIARGNYKYFSGLKSALKDLIRP